MENTTTPNEITAYWHRRLHQIEVELEKLQAEKENIYKLLSKTPLKK